MIPDTTGGPLSRGPSIRGPPEIFVLARDTFSELRESRTNAAACRCCCCSKTPASRNRRAGPRDASPEPDCSVQTWSLRRAHRFDG